MDARIYGQRSEIQLGRVVMLLRWICTFPIRKFHADTQTSVKYTFITHLNSQFVYSKMHLKFRANTFASSIFRTSDSTNQDARIWLEQYGRLTRLEFRFQIRPIFFLESKIENATVRALYRYTRIHEHLVHIGARIFVYMHSIYIYGHRMYNWSGRAICKDSRVQLFCIILPKKKKKWFESFFAHALGEKKHSFGETHRLS